MHGRRCGNLGRTDPVGINFSGDRPSEGSHIESSFRIIAEIHRPDEAVGRKRPATALTEDSPTVPDVPIDPTPLPLPLAMTMPLNDPPGKQSTGEVMARFLVAAGLCVKDGNNRRANVLMKALFRDIAREVAAWRLSGEAKVKLFLRPMEEELVHRYGAILGRRLYWDFVDAFWLQSWSVEPLTPRLEAPEPEAGPSSDPLGSSGSSG